MSAIAPVHTRPELLRPETILRLQSLDLMASTIVEGFAAGLHRSVFKGSSIEFDHHRPFARGDDTRQLDWRVWAKTDRWHIKQYAEETNMRVHIVVDASASMRFASGAVSKFDYARCLAAAFAYLAFRQHDPAGLAIIQGDTRSFLPARSHPSQLHRILQTLAQAQAAGAADVGAALPIIAGKIHRRSLIVLISDLLDEPEPITRALTSFSRRNHELIVLQILDNAEIRFPFQEMSRFVDPESARRLELQPDGIRHDYARCLSELTQQYRRTCGAHGIEYEQFDTTTAFDTVLGRYLARRLTVR